MPWRPENTPFRFLRKDMTWPELHSKHMHLLPQAVDLPLYSCWCVEHWNVKLVSLSVHLKRENTSMWYLRNTVLLTAGAATIPQKISMFYLFYNKWIWIWTWSYMDNWRPGGHMRRPPSLNASLRFISEYWYIIDLSCYNSKRKHYTIE